LKELPAKGRLRLAIDVADAALAERIANALAHVEDVELVSTDDGPDAFVVAESAEVQTGDEEIALSPRELEVLALLAEGASNKLIARRLGISAHTAKYHVASLLEKLDAVSRTDAVAHAAPTGRQPHRDAFDSSHRIVQGATDRRRPWHGRLISIGQEQVFPGIPDSAPRTCEKALSHTRDAE